MAKTDQEKHIPALDGLRGVAILLVISFHYFPNYPLFTLGWSGVDLFFVLSGYLITGRLLSTLEDGDYFKKFYRSRVLRIFPLYYAVMLIFFAAIYLLAKTANMGVLSFYTMHWKSFFLFTENWTFIKFGLPHDAYLVHFWSLAIEEQFYLVWPTIVLLIGSGRSRLITWIFVMFCAICLRIFIYVHNPNIDNYTLCYYNTFCRFDSLIIGAILSQLHFDKYRIANRLSYILLLAFSIVILTGIFYTGNAKLSNAFMATSGYSCLAVFYACVLHIAVKGKSIVVRLLNSTLLRFCGKISYGLYIFHWPAMLILGTRMANWGLIRFPENKLLVGISSGIISLLITFAISYISFRYFESYFLKFKKTSKQL
jgi:peptidoglycan/LPS O-acetylase OafA/YrhL